MFLSLYPCIVLSQGYRFRNYNTEDGLPNSYVYSITQDSLGYLWIGTGQGLSRFNGFSFQTFISTDSISSDFITCSLNSGKNIWFGHSTGYISRFDGNSVTSFSFSDSIQDRVTSLSESQSGNIWASTFSSGIYRLNPAGNSFEKVVSTQELMVNVILHIPNEILIGSNHGLYYCTLDEKEEFSSIEIIPDIPHSKITSIVKAKNGKSFLVATENEGIYRLHPDEASFNPEIIDGTENIPAIQSISEDIKSDLWIGTYGNGLVKFEYGKNGSDIRKFNTGNGFITDNVRAIFEDREGNIWSGNFGEGLTVITHQPFSFFNTHNPDQGRHVFSILSHGRYLWIGTEKGLLKTSLSTDTVYRFIDSKSGLPADTVTSLFFDRLDRLWIGTGRSGVYMMKNGNGKLVRVSIKEGSLENSITCIKGTNADIFIGTKKGLFVFDIQSGNRSEYTLKQGLPNNWINDIYPDNSGKVWVSTKSKVLVYIKESKIFKFPVIIGTGTAFPCALTGDNESRIWISTAGNGIFITGKDTVSNLTTRQGLVSDFCYSIVYDGDYIWAVHKNGLSRIKTSDFSVKSVPGFDDSGNILFNPLAASIEIPGIVRFGTDKGLVTYNPASEVSVEVSPILSITSLRVNGVPVKPENGRLILSSGKYSLRIGFLAVYLKDPHLVTYKYFLEGHDQGWSDITRNRSVLYPEIQDGHYRFLVTASNGDGIPVRAPLELEIIIRKAIWKYWWFYPALTLVCVILVFYYIKYRERRLRVEKKILEEKVKERTHELEYKKNEIEKQRDEITEKNLNLMSSIRYAHQIQKALLPSGETLDRVLPDSFIIHKPKDIVSGDFYWVAERDDKVIFTVGDCTGHGVPGAFMSLLGITLLNEIVNVHGITRPDEIVNELRRRVIYCLQQQRKGYIPLDGIDLSLCVLNRKTNMLQFTGAMNDIVLIRNEKIEVIRADRLDVSITYYNLGYFKFRELECVKGDMLYLFSDGYQDQFGGEFDKKFLRPHFYTILKEIHRHPVLNQKELLEKKLYNWMKNHGQTDDITILGVRL